MRSVAQPGVSSIKMCHPIYRMKVRGQTLWAHSKKVVTRHHNTHKTNRLLQLPIGTAKCENWRDKNYKSRQAIRNEFGRTSRAEQGCFSLH